MIAFIVGVVIATLILTLLVQSGIVNLKGKSYDSIKNACGKVKGDFRAFLCTATGYGVVGVKDGDPFFDPKSGNV